ncbi:hypothetical protein SLE2022_183790 [Rubroshorea leprosula]
MEKRKWLWKKRPSEKSPGETESSGSISSYSGRYSDQQEAFKTSPNNNTQSPEVSSAASANCEDVDDSVKSLTEKLSAALVNISAKEELVKQHAKVAEEAIAGWEKAENGVQVLKKKLEAATQKNSALENRVSHLDGALKECVRQLRQAREEQEQKIRDAITKTTRDWETTKFELESKLLELQKNAESVKPGPPTHSSPDNLHKIETLERENSALKNELLSQLEELEMRTIERDLSNQAAETASKQHLESIKKVVRLEAECRRLKAIASKAFVNDRRTTAASSVYGESLTDNQSDYGERLNAVDIDIHKRSCLDSWTSALITKPDRFRNEKVNDRSFPSSIDITLMDDFLEMEQLAAIHETKNENQCVEAKTTSKHSDDDESSLRAELEAMVRLMAELEDKLEKMAMEKAELQEKLERMETEKAELEIDLTKRQESVEASELQLREIQMRLEELQKELGMANESKQLLESQLISLEMETQTMYAKINFLEAEVERERGLAKESKQLIESQLVSMEAKTRMMSAKINLLEAEVEKERDSSKQITVKCQELEEELSRKRQEAELQQAAYTVETQTMSAKLNLLEAEVERERTSSKKIMVNCQELEEELSRKRQEADLQQTSNSNVDMKIKQEDIAVAAGKLAECQKTIASLGKQLRSLATLEDFFLIDSTSLPELEFPAAGSRAGGSLIPGAAGEPWKLHSNETFPPRGAFNAPKMVGDSSAPSEIKNNGDSPPSSSSSSSTFSSNHASSENNRNGFAKFFTQSKEGIQLEI